MEAPDAQRVLLRSPRMDWASVGMDDQAVLQEEVLDAVEYVENTTGRTFALMPSGLERTAERAVIMRTQQQVFQSDQDNVESAADELTSSMSAGGYSESRRAFSDHKAQNEALMVNSWPELNRLLWQLMTPEKRAEWMGLLSGQGTPSWGVQEVDWDPWSIRSHSRIGELGEDMRGPWPWGR